MASTVSLLLTKMKPKQVWKNLGIKWMYIKKKYFCHDFVETDLQDFYLCDAPINIILIFVVICVILAVLYHRTILGTV